MRHRPTIWLVATSLVFLPLTHAVGQAARSGGSGGSSTAQQVIAQMQQVARERSEAQAEAVKAKEELGKSQEELKKLKLELDLLKSRSVDSEQLQRAQRESQQALSDLERVRGNVTELNRQLHDTAVQLRESEQARVALKSTVANEVRVHAACVRDNLELADLARDALARYEKRVGSHEPFLKISRVRAQNLADEYRARVEDLKAPGPTADAESAAH